MTFVASVRHSGTNFVRHVVGGPFYKAVMCKPGKFGRVKPNGLLHAHFYNRDLRTIDEYSEIYPTVIPLRHPVAVALSWHIRVGERFKEYETEWKSMTKLMTGKGVFWFPIETKPFDALEEYLGREVFRIDTREGGKNPYEAREMWESGDIEALKASGARMAYESGMKLLEKDAVAQRFYA